AARAATWDAVSLAAIRPVRCRCQAGRTLVARSSAWTGGPRPVGGTVRELALALSRALARSSMPEPNGLERKTPADLEAPGAPHARSRSVAMSEGPGRPPGQALRRRRDHDVVTVLVGARWRRREDRIMIEVTFLFSLGAMGGPCSRRKAV